MALLFTDSLSADLFLENIGIPRPLLLPGGIIPFQQNRGRAGVPAVAGAPLPLDLGQAILYPPSRARKRSFSAVNEGRKLATEFERTLYGSSSTLSSINP